MDERIGYAIFLMIFILLYGGMHLFVFSRLSKIFKLERNLAFIILGIVLILSYILASYLESRFSNTLIHALYAGASAWMGIIFILFMFSIIYTLIGFFRPVQEQVALAMLGVAFIAIIYAFINASVLTTRTVELNSSKIDRQLTIVQITDAHIGPINDKSYLRKLVAKANSMDPDIVVITGDLIDGGHKYDDDTFDAIKDINAPAYFVLGNHETYEGTARSLELLNHANSSKFYILRNQLYSLDRIELAGIDYVEGRQNIARELSKIQPGSHKYSILLAHTPNAFNAAAQKNFDLVISGHTHAGQIWPFNYLTLLATRPIYGLHRINETQIYVSSGAATWGPPMRLGSHNEIVKIVISPS